MSREPFGLKGRPKKNGRFKFEAGGWGADDAASGNGGFTADSWSGFDPGFDASYGGMYSSPEGYTDPGYGSDGGGFGGDTYAKSPESTTIGFSGDLSHLDYRDYDLPGIDFDVGGPDYQSDSGYTIGGDSDQGSLFDPKSLFGTDLENVEPEQNNFLDAPSFTATQIPTDFFAAPPELPPEPVSLVPMQSHELPSLAGAINLGGRMPSFFEAPEFELKEEDHLPEATRSWPSRMEVPGNWSHNPYDNNIVKNDQIVSYGSLVHPDRRVGTAIGITEGLQYLGNNPLAFEGPLHNVINRSNANLYGWGDDIHEQGLKAHQYSGMTPGNVGRMYREAGPERVSAAARAFEDILQGGVPDPTMGAMSYARTDNWLGRKIDRLDPTDVVLGHHRYGNVDAQQRRGELAAQEDHPYAVNERNTVNFDTSSLPVPAGWAPSTPSAPPLPDYRPDIDLPATPYFDRDLPDLPSGPSIGPAMVGNRASLMDSILDSINPMSSAHAGDLDSRMSRVGYGPESVGVSPPATLGAPSTDNRGPVGIDWSGPGMGSAVSRPTAAGLGPSVIGSSDFRPTDYNRPDEAARGLAPSQPGFGQLGLIDRAREAVSTGVDNLAYGAITAATNAALDNLFGPSTPPSAPERPGINPGGGSTVTGLPGAQPEETLDPQNGWVGPYKGPGAIIDADDLIPTNRPMSVPPEEAAPPAPGPYDFGGPNVARIGDVRGNMGMVPTHPGVPWSGDEEAAQAELERREEAKQIAEMQAAERPGWDVGFNSQPGYNFSGRDMGSLALLESPPLSADLLAGVGHSYGRMTPSSGTYNPNMPHPPERPSEYASLPGQARAEAAVRSAAPPLPPERPAEFPRGAPPLPPERPAEARRSKWAADVIPVDQAPVMDRPGVYTQPRSAFHEAVTKYGVTPALNAMVPGLGLASMLSGLAGGPTTSGFLGGISPGMYIAPDGTEDKNADGRSAPPLPSRPSPLSEPAPVAGGGGGGGGTGPRTPIAEYLRRLYQADDDPLQAGYRGERVLFRANGGRVRGYNAGGMVNPYPVGTPQHAYWASAMAGTPPPPLPTSPTPSAPTDGAELISSAPYLEQIASLYPDYAQTIMGYGGTEGLAGAPATPGTAPAPGPTLDLHSSVPYWDQMGMTKDAYEAYMSQEAARLGGSTNPVNPLTGLTNQQHIDAINAGGNPPTTGTIGTGTGSGGTGTGTGGAGTGTGTGGAGTGTGTGSEATGGGRTYHPDDDPLQAGYRGERTLFRANGGRVRAFNTGGLLGFTDWRNQNPDEGWSEYLGYYGPNDFYANKDAFKTAFPQYAGKGMYDSLWDQYKANPTGFTAPPVPTDGGGGGGGGVTPVARTLTMPTGDLTTYGQRPAEHRFFA